MFWDIILTSSKMIRRKGQLYAPMRVLRPYLVHVQQKLPIFNMKFNVHIIQPDETVHHFN